MSLGAMNRVTGSFGIEPSEKDIDNMVSQWNAIGFIPRNKIGINQDFLTLVDKAYKTIGLALIRLKSWYILSASPIMIITVSLMWLVFLHLLVLEFWYCICR